MYRNYHALKLAWIGNELKKYPKIYIGKEKVYVIAGEKRYRYKISTENGQKWAGVAMKRNDLQKEYDRLKMEWDSNYKFRPPEISFPLTDSNRMNSAFFDSKEACRNDKTIKNPTYYKNIAFRSKNEQMTAMVLDEMGIENKYETELKISDFLTIHPDFLINSRAADRCVYMEVFGAPDDPDYRETIKNRLRPYIEIGLRPGVDVMMIYAPTSHSFDIEGLRKQIDMIMESITPELT